MGQETIKLELIEWLAKLEDDETIQYLKALKNSKTENNDWWNDLSEAEMASIKQGIDDIENGRTISHEEVKAKYGL
ncbi:hypothetical protein [Psychroflexus aestuariivivens]|uniref:hypothetical protein n=1 Tax=Psychroflexus aestuariivivens TaxID=1795040 RepID=UPI000FD983F8|nr:hypothetical protein [Psychroflexus aestuariivivens]